MGAYVPVNTISHPSGSASLKGSAGNAHHLETMASVIRSAQLSM